ncbi:MAG: hypothetical protein WC498_02000 [Candidatus Saccharimonadales bacterium]
MYKLSKYSGKKQKSHNTNRNQKYLPFSSEPDDSISGLSPLELDAISLANRYFTKRHVRHNIRRMRNEFQRHQGETFSPEARSSFNYTYRHAHRSAH